MKKHVLPVAALGLALTLTACGGGAQELAVPQTTEPLSYTETQTAERQTLVSAAEEFAETFAPALLRQKTSGENVAIAPVSVYSALSLAAVCADGNTQTELLSALGVSFDELKTGYPLFYRGLIAEYRTNANALSGKFTLGNSIWLQSGLPAEKSCLDLLSDQFFCHAYAADFANDNGGANRAVRKFVKDQTNGIIDQDLRLGEFTRFALINSLYLKDVWNEYGKEISLTSESYAFRQGDGSERSLKLMQGYYESGRAFDGGNFTSFFAQTHHGYKLYFMLPKEGAAAEEIFTKENLAALRNADWRPDDEENKIHYHTRCLFPAFEGSFDGDAKETLRAMGIEQLFCDPKEENGCSFALMPGSDAYVQEVLHITKLNVNRRGIEGAAVTVLPAAGAPGPDGWENEYEDFTVDRAFAFVLTDRFGTTLFSGIVNRI